MAWVFDILAIGILALALLVPKTSVVVKPAIASMGETATDLERFAEAQDRLTKDPESIDAALGLAAIELELSHPTWALRTLDKFSARGDFRVEMSRATAYADLYNLDRGVAMTGLARGECDHQPMLCGEPDRVKLGLLEQAMQTLRDQKIDPIRNPTEAREAVQHVLHGAFVPNIFPKGLQK